MKNLSWWKKFKLFLHYRKLINKNKVLIEDKKNGLNLRVDRAYRIYTVYSPPDPEEIKSYGPALAEKFIKQYIGSVEKNVIDWGLTEYIGIWDIRAISEVDFLIVFGFKGFSTTRFFNRILIFTILSIIFSIISYFLFF